MKRTAKKLPKVPVEFRASLALRLWAVWAELLPKNHRAPPSLLQITNEAADEIDEMNSKRAKAAR